MHLDCPLSPTAGALQSLPLRATPPAPILPNRADMRTSNQCCLKMSFYLSTKLRHNIYICTRRKKYQKVYKTVVTVALRQSGLASFLRSPLSPHTHSYNLWKTGCRC